jgi:UDP-4-amino-4-deoxy-L-arabinose formyltransferase/UDP-glucuronic acid dehydrogenase (UDP-4-keto-hexauronic acid decarboxylating)
MFRGPHVLNWAIINGERETGVTAHYMEAEWDTGPIIGMSKFAIDFEDDALTVEEKLHRAAVEVLAMHWEAIVTRTANVYAQDEGRARYWPRRRPEDGRIDWQDSAINVHNLVRALVSPWPGAFAFLGQTKVIFQRVFPREDIQLRESPGTVHYDSTGILNIATAEGWIMVREVLVEGAVVTDKQIGNVLNCQDGDRFA